MSYDTQGGVPTRGTTLRLLLHHLDEMQNQAAVMSHLYNTEDDPTSKALAKAWFLVEERLKHMRLQLIELAKGSLQ